MEEEKSNRTTRESDRGHEVLFIRAGARLLERIERTQATWKNDVEKWGTCPWRMRPGWPDWQMLCPFYAEFRGHDR